MIQTSIHRKGFLLFTFKLFAITSASIPGINCKKFNVEIPPLKSLSEEEYLNIRSIEEIFLKGCPVLGFDLGLAADEHITGHSNSIPTAGILKEIASIPSSRFASLVLDHSLTTLVELDLPDRESRLASWKHSSNETKRGAYSILKQFSFFLLSMNSDYQKYTGYLG